MKKQSKKFMLAGVVLLAIAGLLALTSCKNDSVPEPPSEADWLQEQKKELEDKTEGTYTITAPSYLTEGGLVRIRKVLDEANVSVDLDLSQATGLTYIAAGAFIGCPTLQSVKLPPSVTEIGDFAFQYCSRLTKVTILKGVTTIGAYAFDGCSVLTGVTIPEGVTTIGASAFANTGLTEVTIPKGVTTIGDSAFNGCSSLAEVTIPASVKTIGYSVFSGCESLTSVTILEGVTTIGDFAFYNCYSLTEVTIPANVTEIGQYAFASTGLTDVTIPEDVTTIEAYAFSGCDDLNQVTFQETGGWHMKTDFYDEAESPVSIDVGTPSTNATNFKDYAGEWYDKYLIRVEP